MRLHIIYHNKEIIDKPYNVWMGLSCHVNMMLKTNYCFVYKESDSLNNKLRRDNNDESVEKSCIVVHYTGCSVLSLISAVALDIVWVIKWWP